MNNFVFHKFFGKVLNSVKNIVKTLIPAKARLNLKIGIRKSKGLFLSGNEVECNCCGKKYRKFLPMGNLEFRDNVMCSNCGSLERTRMLLIYLEKETDIFEPGKKVLHFAPEEGLKAQFKKRKNPDEYINGDLNPVLADTVIDMTNISFADNTFDYIICSHILGHIPDEEKAVSELFRVLKPGGKAIVLTLINEENVPTREEKHINTDEKRLMEYGHPTLFRLHGNDMADRLAKRGFEVVSRDYISELPEDIQTRLRIADNQRGRLFICSK